MNITKNICLQIPKVGSSSIHQLIIDEFGITNGHYGSFDYHTRPKVIINDGNSFVIHSHEYRDIPQYIKDDMESGDEYYVINSLRDPIMINISGMFFSDVVKDKGDIDGINQQLYLSSINDNRNGQSYGSEMFKWYYEKLFNPLIGFNVFDIDFDKEGGYSIYKEGNLNILILKTERLDDVYLEAFSKLYGFEFKNKLPHANTQKSQQYLNYKNNTKLNIDFVNMMYDNNYMKHFYTEQEITNFKNKWTK